MAAPRPARARRAPPPARSGVSGGAAAAAFVLLAGSFLAYRHRYPPPYDLGLLVSPEERAVFDFILARGASVAVRAGRQCPTCLRGLVATRALAAGERLLELPLALGLPLDAGRTGAFPAEHARALVLRMHREPGLNETHAAFLASLPRPAELLAAEVFEERLVAALQAPVLEGLVRGQRGVAEAVYYGRFDTQMYTPLVEELGADKAPDLATFSWLAAIVGSRDFVLRSGGIFLLPVADLVNHASGAPNARRDDNGTHVFIVAERAIAAGEEITNDYQPGVIHRPDNSLHIYGFVAPADPPLLPSTDLPTFDDEAPWAVSALTDDGFHGPGGTHLTEAERARLAALVDAAPTTLAEDAALLAGGELDDDPKMRTVVEFRVARKRALARALGRVEAALARGAAGGAEKEL